MATDAAEEQEFFTVMQDNLFLPNSPCLRNAGYDNMLKACFVLPIDDNMKSIFGTLYQAALVFKSGGGCGYNFSNLRQKDSTLSGGGLASGPLSFMRLYNDMTEVVKQGGFRRGASLGVLDVDHPDIIPFIRAKLVPTELTNFNLSVLVNDEFMKKVKTDELVYLRDRKDKRKLTEKLKAKDLFGLIVFSAYLIGDPGMLFEDRINKDNPFKERIKAANPCGEQPLLPYESCCLGSINLNEHFTSDGEFDMDRFKSTAEIGTRFLLRMNEKCEFPFEELTLMSKKTNRVGLGVMGFADTLIKLHIKYDSPETLEFIDKLGDAMKSIAQRVAIRSASVLSIAPTGSLSILAGCSHGIEPLYATDYERHVTVGTFKEKREESEYVRTAHEISPEWHLKIQAQWQKWVDSGVSKTVNLPRDASIQDVYDVYYKAWEMGCKGVTVYRDESRDVQVLNKPKVAKCDGEVCYL